MLDQLESLKKSFEPCLPKGKAYDIIAYMISSTAKQVAGGSKPPTFTKEKFVEACHECKNADLVDANKWVPKTQALRGALISLQAGIRSDRQIALHEKIGGGRGNTNQYWLALMDESCDQAAESQSPIDLDISYQQTAKGEVRPSVWLRWIFSNGELRNRSPKGLLFFGILFLLSASWVLLFVLSILGMYLSHEPLTIGHLTRLFVSCLFFYLVWRFAYHPWWQLVEHRVTLARTGVTAFSEDPCQLEMFRHNKEKWIRLVRFTADCPLCGGAIELADGKPDQRVPLVGRCQESPHYHVFSFDRTQHAGTYIGPQLPGSIRHGG